MEARDAFRKSQWLDECQSAPEIFEQVIPRLYSFMQPFVKTRTSNAKTSQRLRLVLVSPACPCKASSAGMRGTMHRCDMRCSAKSRPTWDKLMGCWCSIPRGFPRPGGSRWGWPGSGAAGWAKSTPVKSPSPWATSRVRAIPWWPRGFSCPQHGRRRRPAWTKRASRPPAEATARGTNWPWRCWRNTVPRCPTGGWPVTTRWGVRIGVVVAWRPWASALCWRSPRTRRDALWRRRRQSPVGKGAAPRVHGKACRPGASRLTMRPGGASLSAMVRKVH